VKLLRQILPFLGIALLMVLLLKGGGCPTSRPVGAPPGARVVTISVAGRPDPQEKDLSAASFSIQAEVADTVETRRQGLTGRGGLEPGHGMLYVYPEPQQPEFEWSKMGFPVSDAFLAPDGTILAIQQAAAHDQAAYTPEQPAKFVLELRSGWFQDRGVKAGDRLVLPADLAGAQAGRAAEVPLPSEKPAE
jgi:uncharacterized membrane protein (UPF0127 family)